MKKGMDEGAKTSKTGKGDSGQKLDQSGGSVGATSGKGKSQSGIPGPKQKPAAGAGGVRTDEVKKRREGQQPK